MGSYGPWDDWGAGDRREICWARKLHGLLSWAGTSDDFKGFGLVVREWIFPGLCCNPVSHARVMDMAPVDMVAARCPLCPQCAYSILTGQYDSINPWAGFPKHGCIFFALRDFPYLGMEMQQLKLFLHCNAGNALPQLCNDQAPSWFIMWMDVEVLWGYLGRFLVATRCPFSPAFSRCSSRAAIWAGNCWPLLKSHRTPKCCKADESKDWGWTRAAGVPKHPSDLTQLSLV